jgi:biopolymer transport protein ExbD
MQKSRLIRNRIRRKAAESMEVDITSLLDILVTILIFLLKGYSASTVIINVPKEIVLPRSESTVHNQEGVILQVSDNRIFVDDQVVAEIDKTNFNTLYEDDLKIVPLFNELVRRREDIENLNKSIAGAKPFTGMVNLVMDKNVKYDFLRKLMYTCGEAGFIKFKFVVLAEIQ